MIMLPLPILAIESENDRQWMTECWKKHQALMYKAAYASTADTAEAEDIVSDSLVKLIGQIERIRELPDDELRRYIAVTVRHTAINRWRRLQRTQEHITCSEDAEDLPDQQTPELALLWSEQIDAVRKAIDTLPARDRDLLRMKYYEGCSDREITLHTGLKENNVRKYVERARTRLKARLAEEEHHD